MLRYVVSFTFLLAVGCVDVPDPDTPNRFACIDDEDCIEDYVCSPMGRCIPEGGANGNCTPMTETACDGADKVIWVDSCLNPGPVQDDCAGRGECCFDLPDAHCDACSF